jgi:NADPH:quinone reductase-like Zn-dependent oxidoreductase
MEDSRPLPAALKAHFPAGAEVIFDTTGFCLPAAVDALAPMGRIAVIAAPVDGLVNVPILNLYRKGGSIVGINSLLYDSSACASMLSRIAKDFEQGLLPAPSNLVSCPLANGLVAYQKVNASSAEKIVLNFG